AFARGAGRSSERPMPESDVCPAARCCAIGGSCGYHGQAQGGRRGFMSRPIQFLRVDKPLMVFGGPYSNLEATRAVLDEAARLSISPGRIVCTGDVVDYGADAAATVDLVRDRVGHVVMGNCEQSLAAGSDDCGCWFPTGRKL